MKASVKFWKITHPHPRSTVEYMLMHSIIYTWISLKSHRFRNIIYKFQFKSDFMEIYDKILIEKMRIIVINISIAAHSIELMLLPLAHRNY